MTQQCPAKTTMEEIVQIYMATQIISSQSLGLTDLEKHFITFGQFFLHNQPVIRLTVGPWGFLNLSYTLFTQYSK